MKEKSFKFRESFWKCIQTMDDQTAGQFIKVLCDYVFDNQLPKTSNSTLKSSFALIKTMLDSEAINRENGKRGGIISARLRQAKLEKKETVAKVFAGGVLATDAIADIIGTLKEKEKPETEKQKSVAENVQNEAG